MTVIAAYLDAETGRAAIASDSEMTKNNIRQRTRRKFLRLGEALVGVAGDSSYLRFLETVEDELSHEADAYEWACSLAELAFNFKKPITTTDGGQEEQIIELEMLVVTRSTIHEMSHFKNVVEITDGYAAVGSGGDVALGALALAHRFELAPDEAVLLAVEAAKEHGEGCGGKAHLGCLGFREPKPKGRRKKS